MTSRSGLIPVAAVVLALALAGCGAGVASLSIPEPPAVTVAPPPPPDSLPAGLANETEAPVPGVSTTIAPAIGPGSASMTGTVLGPGGPVRGATVEADRFVGDAVASVRTTTAADGSFSFRDILGGRYRVRAWQAPSLDMATPQFLFLLSDQPQALTLQLTSYAGQQLQVAINPGNPVENQTANLVIQVTNPAVNADGVLAETPVVGTPVTLVNGPGWEVSNSNPSSTDYTGQALFQVVCTTVGPDPLSAQVGNQAPVALQMPGCGAPSSSQPTSPTTASPGGGPATTTTTSCPPPSSVPGDSSTTSTSLVFGGC